jgi:dihydrofolate reductase
MAKLSMTIFMTLDGVTQAPGAPQEDTSGGFTHGGWFMVGSDPEFGQFIVGVIGRAQAFLLGRKTYDIFSNYWPKVTDPNHPIAGPLNRLPKYVASKTLQKVDWAGSSLIRNVESDVAHLKQELSGEIQVHGSGNLARSMLAADLVDEMNIVLAPVVLGSGKRLFEPGSVPAAFKLLSSHSTGAGRVISTYERAGKPTYGSPPPPT